MFFNKIDYTIDADWAIKTSDSKKRKIIYKLVNKEYKNILRKIKKSAEDAKYSIRIYYYDKFIYKEILPVIKNILEEKRFFVKVFVIPEAYDNDGFYSLPEYVIKISWKNNTYS